jgi:hypothetical protein
VASDVRSGKEDRAERYSVTNRDFILNLSFFAHTKLREPAATPHRRFDMNRYEKTSPRGVSLTSEEQMKRDAEARMRERDARIDDRTETDRLLGVPPSWRSALKASG